MGKYVEVCGREELGNVARHTRRVLHQCRAGNRSVFVVSVGIIGAGVIFEIKVLRIAVRHSTNVISRESTY